MFLKANEIPNINKGNITSNSFMFTFLNPSGKLFSFTPETVYNQPTVNSLSFILREEFLKREKMRRNEKATSDKR